MSHLHQFKPPELPAPRVCGDPYRWDVNPGAEPGKFGKIAEAYEVLSDGNKRRRGDVPRGP